MTAESPRRTAPLTVDEIVDAARALIARDGLPGLSMRRLGSALGIDPMAVYHHVGTKRDLLARVMARVVGGMTLPDPADRWDARVRDWARAYRGVVVANRDLVAAGLADPVVAAGGMPQVAPLRAAVADSGIAPDLVDANVWLVVDFVHGAGLGTAAPARSGGDDTDPLVAAFEAGLDTIVAGIAAAGRPRR